MNLLYRPRFHRAGPRVERLERRTLLSLAPAGSEFRANDAELHQQFESDVSMAADGDFVVAWWVVDAASRGGISARLFNADGTPKGGDIVVTPMSPQLDAAGAKPTVAMAADGHFVVAWLGSSPDPNAGIVLARVFNADGTPRTNAFTVDPDLDPHRYSIGNNRDITAAMSDDGRFVIAWSQLFDDLAAPGQFVAARLFDADARPVGEGFRANSSAAGDARNEIGSAMDAEGDFVITWHNVRLGARSDTIIARRYRRDGTPQGNEFTVGIAAGEGSASAVAMDSDGDFVVTWQQNRVGGSWISARQYDRSGNPKAPPFTAFDVGPGLWFPDVAMDDAGSFLVSWRVNEFMPDMSERDRVYARHFGADGQPLTGAMLVGGPTISGGVKSNVAINAAGDRAVVTWDDDAPGGPLEVGEVFARRLVEGAEPPPPPPPSDNTAPAALPIPDVAVGPDAPNTVIPLFDVFQDTQDPDTALTFQVTGNTNAELFTATAIDPPTGRLFLNYAAGKSGQATITVTATDTGGLSTPVSFHVTVGDPTEPPPPPPDNQPPTSAGIPPVTATQDPVTLDPPNTVVHLLDYFQDAIDPDSALHLAVTGNSNPTLFNSVTLNPADGTLTLDYAPLATGTGNITITATDTGGLSVSSAMAVTVNPPPQTPAPLPEPGQQGLGWIRGMLFDDADGNGRKSRREAPMSGVTVFLDTDADAVLDANEASVVTGPDGSYQFTGLPATVYHVRPNLPGAAAVNVTIPVNGRRLKPVKLKPTPVSGGGGIAGSVFLDANADGVREEGEVGAKKVRVFLDTNGDGVWQKKAERAAATDATGNWSFRGLPAGTFRVGVVTKRKLVASAPAAGAADVVLADGATVGDVLLGVRRASRRGA